jgi:RNA polymerase sigma-70 factor, ECF subfamily
MVSVFSCQTGFFLVVFTKNFMDPSTLHDYIPENEKEPRSQVPLDVVKGILEGDEDSFKVFFDSQRRLLFLIINRVINNDADAENCLMDAMLEVWNLRASYDHNKGEFLGWVITLTRRRAIDRLRAKQSYSRALERLGAVVYEEEKIHAQEHHDVEVKDERHERIMELIYSVHIPDAQRECLLLHWIEGLSQRQIAEHTGISLGTIKTRLELGLETLTVLVSLNPALGRSM